MQTQLDAGRGQTVGSRIRLNGGVFNVQLSVEEIVNEFFDNLSLGDDRLAQTFGDWTLSNCIRNRVT